MEGGSYLGVPPEAVKLLMVGESKPLEIFLGNPH